ncbi:MAG: COX15/CtaA family protein [Flavobacteriales bacterium]|nr:COX15/CtaA family protein [Flavobacteriales bacterium]
MALIAIYAVILAGSIVRVSGSGMGCPDWPKCFDQWVPPTHIDQLPVDYRETFRDRRIQKLDRFVSYLEKFGMTDVAQKIKEDKSLLEEEPFIASKTWTEYINRLLGALAGMFLVLGFILSFRFWKRDPMLIYLSFLALLATSIQGWLGSIVVTTNLLPWMVTVHMSFALLVIALLVIIIAKKNRNKIRRDPKWKMLLAGAIGITLLQVYFGTQVRQEIDMIAKAFADRGEWIQQMGSVFFTHRTFAILVLVVNVVIVYLFYKENRLNRAALTLLGIVLIEVLTGIILSYFSVPKTMQVSHLFLACAMFGVQIYLISKIRRRRRV